MKPIQLVISAFGSFCGKESIDFTKLGDKGIFLVTGETGSGKTTIFDAIMYALYGSTSGETGDTKDKGEARSIRNIRSDYAVHNTETYVELTFRHRGMVYRIYRSPAYDRINSKGNIRKKSAEAELYLCDGACLAAGTKDVTAKVTEILGIGQKDFLQLVMIAQGKFRELLTASNEKREEIFRKIFSTEIYERFTERMKEESIHWTKEYLDEKYKFADSLSSIKVSEEYDFYDSFNEWCSGQNRDFYDGTIFLPKLAEMIEQDREKETVLKKAKAETEELENRLNLQYNNAERINKSIEMLENCKREYLALTSKGDSIKCMCEELTEAETAEEIRPLYEADQRAAEDLKKAEQNCTEKQKYQKLQAAVLEDARKKCGIIPSLEQKIQEVGGFIQILRESRSQYAVLTELQKQLKQIQFELKRSRQICEKTHISWEHKRAEQAQLEKVLTENKDSAVRLNALQNEKQKAEEILKRLNDLIDEAKTIGSKKKAYEAYCEQFRVAQADYKQRRSVYEQAEDLFFSAQAGILAERLEENQPCPVCGSCHHPKKAIKPAQTATQEQLDNYRQTYERSQNEYTKIFGICTAAKSEYNTLKEKFFRDTAFLVDEENSTNLSVIWAEIIAQKRLIQQNIQNLEKQIANEMRKTQTYITAEQQSRRVSQEIEVLAENEKRLTMELSDNEAAERAKQAEIKTVQSQLMYASEEILQEQMTLKTQERTKYIQEKEDLQRQLSNAQEVCRSALDLCSEAESHRNAVKEQQAAAQSDFQTVLKKVQWHTEEFLAKIRTKEQRDEMRQFIDIYREQMTILTEREKNLNEQIKGAVFQDLTILREQINEAHQQKEIQEENLRILQRRQEENSYQYDKALCSMKRIEILQDRYTSYKRLSDTVSGTLSGTARITFESFVQTFYFDMVLKEANKRFKVMSSGQYELRRKKPTSLQGKTGLDLDVFDYYTGKSRPVQTLSGGESFMASLSLALGLSDIIQSRKGGIEIDTLFIDEGFGTLDEKVLEQAIHILNVLTEGDKMIGLISHVEALKGRIDKKIIVQKTPSGSHIIFCGEG